MSFISRTTLGLLTGLACAGTLNAQTTPRLNGDITNDGAVTAADAQAVLQVVVGLALPTTLNPLYGDANCDGLVTALDAQIILMATVQMPVTQFCVTKAADPETFTLVPESSSLATYQYTTAIVRGIKLTNPSYTLSLGTATMLAEPVNDSTLAFVVPAVAAGAQTLKLSTGKSTGATQVTVTETPAVADPQAFMTNFFSSFGTELTATATTVARATSHGLPVNETGLQNDLATARTEQDSAKAQFAALSAEDQQEAANILQATYGSTLFAIPPAAGGATLDNEVGEPLCFGGMADEHTAGCPGTVTQPKVAWWKKDTEACKTEMDEAKGWKPTVKTFAWHAVNGCAASRLVKWASETYDSLKEKVIAKLDRFTSFFDDIENIGNSPSGGGRGSTAGGQSVWASNPVEFTNGVGRRVHPKMRFRPMIAADTATDTTVANIAHILDSAAVEWKALDSLFGNPVQVAPPTIRWLESVSDTVYDTYPPANIQLGAITPSSVTGTASLVDSALTVTFSAATRLDVPFSFDLIYDGGLFGADTMHVSAVLTRPKVYFATLGGDSTGAAALSDSAVVVGWSRTADSTAVPFRWENGAMQSLGLPAGYTWGAANSVSRSGNVIGGNLGTEAVKGGRGFLWIDGTMTPLGSEGSGPTTVVAVNNGGSAVGLCPSRNDDPVSVLVACVMTSSTLTPLTGGAGLTATGINNAGVIVGSAIPTHRDPFTGQLVESGTADLPAIWENGVMRLMPIPADSANMLLEKAVAINDLGNIVTWTQQTSVAEQRWYLWTNGVPKEITVPGAHNIYFRHLDERGRVLITYDDAAGGHVAIWENGTLADVTSIGGWVSFNASDRFISPKYIR
jgi:uncharacterized membrane protein